MGDNYWINEMVFLTGGKAFGVHKSGKTSCLGIENAIKEILISKTIPREMPILVKETLEIILQVEKELQKWKIKIKRPIQSCKSQ